MRKFKRSVSLFICVLIIFIMQINDIAARAYASEQEIKSLSEETENMADSDDGDESYFIYFQNDFDSLDDESKMVIQNYPYGTLPTPDRTGYTFDGWYTQSENGVRITETSIVEQSVSHDLYAHWKPIGVSIYFNANGGSLNQSSKVVYYGQTYGALPVPSLSGYSFKGWYTSPNGGGLISENSNVDITSSIMLYAHWSGADVTVTFNPSGGTVSEATKEIGFGESYGSLPVPVKAGYLFEGWYLVDGGYEITSASSVNYNVDHTLYAQWSQAGYKITFDDNGGSVTVTSKTIMSGDQFGSLPTPTKTGYNFLGWYTSLAADGAKVTSRDRFIGTAPQTLYAHWTPNEYTVHLRGNGAALNISDITVSYDGNYSALPIPALEHYTFDGWYTGASSGTLVSSTTRVNLSSDETLYAHWTGVTQTVYFNTNGGSSSTSEKTVYYGRNYGSLPTPLRTGYTFEGWYPSLNSTEEIASADTVRLTAPQTLYAHWTVKKPEITYDGNGGSVIANGELDTSYTVILTYGNSYGTLPNAIRDGYTFDGWYTSSTSGTQIFSYDLVAATSSDTLYAHWIANTYHVYLNANGGVNTTPSDFDATYGKSYGTMPMPIRDNYTFLGWYTEKTGGTKISSTTTVRILGSQTLYAQWEGIETRVYFDPYGGSTSTSSKLIHYNETYGVLPVPTNTGYNFTGWFTQPSGGIEITEDTVVKTNENQTVYAHWSAKQPVITFDANGGSVSITSKIVTYGQTYGTLPTPSRPGYVFQGWYTSKTGGSNIAANNVVSISSDDILYAQWLGYSYTVYFDANGGSVSTSSKSVTNGSSYGTLTSATRSGFTFGGWYTEISGGVKISSTSIVDITSSITLYAHWTQEVYTVTYNANGGSVTPSSTTVTKGTSYSDFPTPTRDGYTFTGWYSSSSASGTLITYTTTTDTLYAHWAGNTYQVLFDGNGGTASTSAMNVIYGDKYGALPTAVRQNYTLAGWYSAATGGTKRTETSTVSTIGTHTLYAHWTGITSKLSYDSNGGTSITTTKTVTYDDTYGTLSTPSRTGYTFDGWYTSPTGGTLINSSSIVTETSNHTIYAHWTIKKCEITYNANGGRVLDNGYKVSSAKVVRDYGETYGSLPVATRSGYTFLGWYTSSTTGTRITESTVITAADTIYAHWEGISYSVIFDANGGTSPISSMNVVHGNDYGTLPEPLLTGYAFQGWFTSISGGVKITSSTDVALLSNQILYAQWQEATIKITYNGNGGSHSIINENNEVTVVSSTSRSLLYQGTYGGSDGMLPSFSRSGHDLIGWFTDAAGGSEVKFNDTLDRTEPQTLYAHWEPANIRILLNENGADPLSLTKSVAYGSAYGYLPRPTLDNYTFKGWFTSKTGNVQVTEQSIMSSSSRVNIYAQWEPGAYLVEFNANGGSVSQANTTVYYDATYGTLPTPTKENYAFNGWYTEPVGGNRITSSNVVNINTNIILYAHWAEGSYRVTFNGNGGSVDITGKNVMYNQNYGSLPIPTRTGYYFTGWYTDTTNGNLITPTDKVLLNGSQTLYAHWTAMTPTIIFYANGGNLSQTAKTAEYGTVYGELPVPTLAHYTFDGWFTTKTGTTKITSTSSFQKTSTVVLYAQWTPEGYTVTLDATGGTLGTTSKTVSYEREYGILISPYWSEHNFLGWYTKPVGGVLVKASSLVTITSNHTLYAHWSSNIQTVTFDAQGGNISSPTKTVTKGSKYGELPMPAYEGHTFVGWFTSPNGDEEVTANTVVNTEGDHVLYARWEENDGEESDIIEIDKSMFTYDETLGYYNIINGNIIDRIWGTLNLDISTVDTFTFTIKDDAEIVLKSGSIGIEENWSINDIGFMMGVNILEVQAVLDDDTVIQKDMKILCTNPDNIININLDTEDNDGDGLNNYLESYYGINKDNPDTDGDGLTDYLELMVLNTNPKTTDTNNNSIDDGAEDTDGDGLSNLSETEIGTDPGINDTDQDNLTDYDEVNMYQTNPLSQDTDGDGAKDGWELENGYDPLIPDASFTVIKSVTAVSGSAISISVNTNGIYADTLSMNSIGDSVLISNEIPGMIEEAYDITLGGQFNTATISYTLDPQLFSDPTFVPTVYYFNEEEQMLEEIVTTVTGNIVTAELTHFSTYVLINKTVYDGVLSNETSTIALIDNTTDSNSDGISDYYTQLMCEGKILTTTHKRVFNDKTFIQIQANDDYDGDGRKNGDEIQVVQDYYGRLSVKLLSSPLNKDTDGDGLYDDIDVNPLIWNVCDRDLAIFASLAYEDGTNFIGGIYSELDIKGADGTGEYYYFMDYAEAKEISSKWKIINYVNKWADIDTYFSATTFKNGNNIVIAYRGTNEKIGEWINNIIGVGLFNYHSEEIWARAYAAVIADNYPQCNIYITGHSLGGYLAQIGTAELLASRPNANIIQVSYFNGIGLKYNKLMFWMKNKELNLLSDFYNHADRSNLISYYIEGDIVSGLGKHSGQKIGFLATQKQIDYHSVKYENGTKEDFITKYSKNVFSTLSSVEIEYYYELYNSKSIEEYLHVTHETDCFLYYLIQGRRGFIFT